MNSNRPFKLIITGSCEFDDYDTLKLATDWLLYEYEDVTDWINTGLEIVSGGALGADLLGERYAIEHDYPIKRFPANWKMRGRNAAEIRNRQMAIYADVLIAFPPCSGHLIKTARDLNVNVRYGERLVEQANSCGGNWEDRFQYILDTAHLYTDEARAYAR